MISKDTNSATSSPASADGHLPLNGQDGAAPSGPAVVHVSRFRALDSTRAMPTNATSGPLFSALSPSAALSASLASRLQARMDVNGSPEYELTWKHWDMPAGPLVYRLRASPRRMSVAGCIGWPTPRAADGHKNTRTYQGAINEAQRVGLRRSDLQTVAQVMVGDRLPLAGWPTPDASSADINDSTWQERQARLREKYNNGNGFGLTLGMAVQIAGWGTPQARDWKEVGDLSNIPINGYLPQQVRGAITNGSGAPTQRLPLADTTGALNPQFSCWLMGYPQEWVSCADSATP